MEKTRFEKVNEIVHYETLSNGLRVYLLPKKDYNKTFAVFTTDYGSIHNTFTAPGKVDPLQVPDGIAHFLEHKMFEKEDGDVFLKFGEKGASANAFTSFTRTAYLFSSTNQVAENLETLIDFVQKPYFTEETVEKEKDIIAQEIKMYDDDPDFRSYFGAIQNMYHNHPVKTDIAGTVESIHEITKDLLDLCYKTFYHPSNMILFVVGNIDPEKTMNDIRENQSKKTFASIGKTEYSFPEEPEAVATSKRKIKFPVQIAKNLVGIKENIGTLKGIEAVKHEIVADISLELLFGSTSDNYLDFYNKGIIDNTFSFDYTLEGSFSFVLIGGDAKDADQQAQAILSAIEKASETGVNVEDLELVKRKKIGQFFRSLNSLEFIANQFVRYIFKEALLFDIEKVIAEVQKKDVDKFIRSLKKEERTTIFQLIPEK